ncbi:MAG: insulinase family protein [Bacteriovoracaceae bacterium]|nr:insulinase family protein [Bacteriovoracaceae bacterium]
MTTYTVGQKIGGHQIERVTELASLGQTYIELTHLKTKSKHIHLANSDKNNVFGVAFKTTPSDSTGVAHILEHTALCGSKKYPIRDPFFTMIRRSLNTFMNAFTSSDWTMYPYASQNEKDFYNLMEVYLDASFFPNLSEIDFKQEGHRFEFEKMDDADSKLKITGVVYNEMKGAMSQPASVMHRRLGQAMFPTITYGNNSGGEPANIPDLTYGQFVDFHNNHYHPSNAYFYTYGNLPLEKHLDVIEREALSKFESLDAHTDVPDEKRYSEPKDFEFFYPLNKDDDNGEKNMAYTGWLTNRCFDMVETLSMQILEEVLLGHAGAPLNKALMESGLGKKLCPGTGYGDETREATFGAGLDGVKREDTKKVEALILDTLKEVASKGISQDEIDAAIHQLEFHTREITGAGYPYGLNLFFRFCGSWFHGGDPIKALDFDQNMDAVRAKISEGRYLEGLIEDQLLNNKHRISVVLSPDHEMENREADKLQVELDSLRSKMTPAEIKSIVDGSLALKAHQEKEEDFGCLPSLSKDDLDRKTPRVAPAPTSEKVETVDFTSYVQETNGIGYLDLYFDITGLSEDELLYTPLLASLMTQCGVGEKNYVESSEEMNRYTGGLWASVGVQSDVSNADYCGQTFSLKSKAIERNIPKMIELLQSTIADFNLTDLERVETVIQKRLSSIEAGVLSSGHGYAINLALRGMSKSLYRSELLSGIGHLALLKDIVKAGDYKGLTTKLKALGQKLFSKSNLQILSVGQSSALDMIKSEVAGLITSLPLGSEAGSDSLEFESKMYKEAWTTTTPVSYVAKAFKVPNMCDDDGAKLRVLSEVLRAGHLHPEIREKGGAYGGMSSYNGKSGSFNLLSYRDPHLKRTRGVYEDILEYLKSGKTTQVEVDEFIISIFGGLDTPSGPYSNCAGEFSEKRNGMTEEIRQYFRDGIFSAKLEEVIEAGLKYLSQQASLVAITSEDIVKRDEATDLELHSI